MKKSTIVIVGLAIILVVSVFIVFNNDAITPSVTSFEDCVRAGNFVLESYPRQCRTSDGQVFIEALDPSTLIQITAPAPNTRLQSPITVTGEARGPWYFEASFPVELQDVGGTVLAAVPVQAQGDWMTTEFVPFSAQISFDVAEEIEAVLVFKRDNPSGLPEYDAEVRIPVVIY